MKFILRLCGHISWIGWCSLWPCSWLASHGVWAAPKIPKNIMRLQSTAVGNPPLPELRVSCTYHNGWWTTKLKDLRTRRNCRNTIGSTGGVHSKELNDSKKYTVLRSVHWRKHPFLSLPEFNWSDFLLALLVWRKEPQLERTINKQTYPNIELFMVLLQENNCCSRCIVALFGALMFFYITFFHQQ